MDWKKQNPCSIKFRNSIFYVEDSKLIHDVSPMKYLPIRKITEESRYKKYGIGIGFGKRSNDKLYRPAPGPGDYNLPSLFKKGLQGKYPMN